MKIAEVHIISGWFDINRTLVYPHNNWGKLLNEDELLINIRQLVKRNKATKKLIQPAKSKNGYTAIYRIDLIVSIN